MVSKGKDSIKKEFGYVSIEPAGKVVAGSRGTWKIIYTAGKRGIDVGGSLRIIPPHQGAARWEVGLVTASTTRPESSLQIETFNTYPISFHWRQFPVIQVRVFGSPLKKNDKIIVTIGEKGGFMNGYKRLAKAQTFAYAKARFDFLLDPEGNRSFPEEVKVEDRYIPLNSVEIEVIPDKIKRFEVVAKMDGERITILVSPKDKYDNPAPYDYKKNKIFFLSKNGKIISPQKSFFSKTGKSKWFIFKKTPSRVERITGIDPKNGVIGTSNPVVEKFVEPYNIFWGDLHVMRFLPGVSVRDTFKYARDIAGLDFCVETNNDQDEKEWKECIKAVKDFYQEGKFVTLLAREYPMKKGHRNVYYLESNQPNFNTEEPEKLWKFLKNKTALVIPHHTNIHSESSKIYGWEVYDLSTYNPQYERLIEISQCRGSFEKDKPGEEIIFGGFGSSVQDFLKKGFLVGFVGGTDTHRGQPGSRRYPVAGLDPDYVKTGGLTAVLARRLTRKDIWESLWNRRCYATTGKRILLSFFLNKNIMGSIIPMKKQDTYKRRVLEIRVVGTNDIESITIVRNNVDIYTRKAKGEMINFTYSDEEKPEKINLISGKDGEKILFYYIRVKQADKEMAWSSPVWLIWK